MNNKDRSATVRWAEVHNDRTQNGENPTVFLPFCQGGGKRGKKPVNKICALKAMSCGYLLRERTKSKQLRSLRNVARNYILKAPASLTCKYLSLFTSKTPLCLQTLPLRKAGELPKEQVLMSTLDVFDHGV